GREAVLTNLLQNRIYRSSPALLPDLPDMIFPFHRKQAFQDVPSVPAVYFQFVLQYRPEMERVWFAKIRKPWKLSELPGHRNSDPQLLIFQLTCHLPAKKIR